MRRYTEMSQPTLAATRMTPPTATLFADTQRESAIKNRGYFDPKKVTHLLEQMRTTREFIYCKQVVSLVILELWHRAFVDRSYGV